MSFILGLTGTFGSGKTTAGGMLRELGAELIDADELARQVVEPGEPALAEIAAQFGAEMIRPDGALDRRRLADRVFADRRAMARLNQIIHPRVRELERKRLGELADRPLVVLDVPLLYETGMDRMCTQVAVVRITENQRFARLRRRGFNEQAIIARLGMQMAQARKVKLADHVIDNSGSLDETRNQLQRLLEEIRQTRMKAP
ncbi:MAG TPA: dephospho-CoA kinase [Candidatus Sumerlaeota bacterium]|nr:MAG: Dephospho-CoA kinase [candidate division BRC1 bacterium ADurb.BinA292]HOR28239.1 dephospho-CoA kinase [Candidatus Sumerlaeota bacterium]HPK01707.1 dephospho-CoA kinase [Candidatus Sumerlaeota bacterium]